MYVYDEKAPGLALCITAAGSRTFYFYKWANGHPLRERLGAADEITIEQARKLADKRRAAIADGRDLQAERRDARRQPTFKDLFDFWIEDAKQRKKTWREDERQYVRYLTEWTTRRLSTIKKTDVAAIHSRIGKDHGHYAANRALALVRAMFNRAGDLGYQGPNPALGVRKFREESRDRFLQPDELPRFFAVLADEEPTVRDFFWLCLLTGARKSNVMSMAWADVSFDLALWRIPETKSGRVVVVPLVPQALDVLRARREVGDGSPWVFPANSSTGHLMDVYKPWERICQRAGLPDLHIHDLRRTMGSWQAATGASLPIIGRMLGHSDPSATAVYARLALDPVRQAAEKAVAAIEAAGKATKTGHEAQNH